MSFTTKEKKRQKSNYIYITYKKIFRVAITQGCKDQASVLLTL